MAIVAAVVLSGCADLPNVSQRPWSAALSPATEGALALTAAASVPPGDDLSGFRLIVSGIEALQARMALIEQARVSLDLQVYQFKGDATGLRLMAALRDAAARGVRVRVLVDDLYTAGDDALWLALAAHDGIEVRLFNPSMAERDSVFKKLVIAILGDERRQRRMHAKLLVADGVMALAGGRNIADAYFAQSQDRFFDVDVLVAGPVVEDMAAGFDLYWNSDYAHELRTVVQAPPAAELRRQAFSRRVAGACDPPDCRTPGPATALRGEFDRARIDMRLALAVVAFDSPHKIENEQVARDIGMLATSGAQVRLLVAQAMQRAQQELLVVSPYLIPGATGVRAIEELRRRGVRLMFLTNSLAATDEPAVHLGYRKYRVAMLRAGVELYEWSPARGGRVLREVLAGGRVLRLHAKVAVVDRHLVYIGSMNLDPRSSNLNTELGLLIRSEELAEDMRALIERMVRDGAYRVRLDEDGQTLRWTVFGEGGGAGYAVEPDTDLGSRLLLDLLEPLVAEELL